MRKDNLQKHLRFKENLMKTKQPELNKITALYERLSRDDEQSGDTKHRRL